MSVTTHAGTAVRLDAWRSVFQKTNRILSERPVQVRIASAQELPHGYDRIPGWSDGGIITFNGPLLIEMLSTTDPIDAVLRLKGLNYHELSHNLYTPRLSDELPRRVLEHAKSTGSRSWWYAFNALEDQRIETLFTSTYSPSRRYFEAAVMQWLVKSGNAEAAILMYGRKYLPARLRVQAGRVFVKKHGHALYEEFQQVIDAYLLIRLPQESVLAFQHVRTYHELLQRMQLSAGTPLPELPIRDNGCGDNGGIPQKGDPTAVRVGRILAKESNTARENAQKAMEEANQADKEVADQMDAEKGPAGDMPAPSLSSDGDSQSGPEGQEGMGTGSDGQDSQDGSPSDGGGQGQSGSTDAAPSDAPADGAGAEGSVPHGVMDQSLQDELDDMIDQAHSGLDDIADDEKILEDVSNILKAVKAVEQDGKIDAEGPSATKATTRYASDDEKLTVRRIVQILTRIRQDLEPQILRRQVAGRLDVRRALTRRPNEVDIFTRYDEGDEESTGIEAVVLMDVSQSMRRRADDASTAVWVLKRAFDKLEIRTTVLIFDTDHKVVYQPSDKAPKDIPIINTGGNTDPTSALEAAVVVLKKSNAPNKVLITVTDGDWGRGNRDYKPVMQAIHKTGAISLLLGLDQAVHQYGRHYHHYGHDLAVVKELSAWALKLVAAIMRNAARN